MATMMLWSRETVMLWRRAAAVPGTTSDLGPRASSVMVPKRLTVKQSHDRAIVKREALPAFLIRRFTFSVVEATSTDWY